jgi:acetyl-CoA carboxylase biotin carboxyl carrier protein
MGQVLSIMAGTVLQVHAVLGESITDGQDVVVLESMKMEVPIAAEGAGTVTKVHVQPGDFVNEGDALIDFE